MKDLHAFLSERSEKVIETSCARVYLQPTRALKIKKPVNFGFLDYSTLEKRQWALQRELNFNRAAAPDIYRVVHAVTVRDDEFDFDGVGEPVEYALEMRRFDDEAVLAHQPWAVDPDLAETLGRTVARFHAQGRILPRGGVAALSFTVESNAALLRDIGERLGPDLEPTLSATERAWNALKPLIEERERQGFSRHCHGDLHLGNILLEDGRPVLFDCIEFNDILSELDVVYDLAFLLMDLHFRRRTDAANRVLNAYLDEAARHFPETLWAGLAALPLTQSVRAGVRSHVSAHAGDDDAAQAYLAAALDHLRPRTARLIAVGGLSGSGKSTLAHLVAPAIGAPPGAVILRTDEIRKRLWGAGHDQALPAAAYTPALTARTYDALIAEGLAILKAGGSVMLDATFLDDHQRLRAGHLADAAGVPLEGVWLQGDRDLLAGRIRARSGDASDATVAVLDEQLARRPAAPSDWRVFDAADLEGASQALIAAEP